MPDRREPDSVKIARLEQTVEGIREDVAEIKAVQGTFVDRMDHRLSYIEDVRLTGLEQREIRQKAIADERARASEQKKHQLSRRDLWLTAALVCLATILAALIASGHLF